MAQQYEKNAISATLRRIYRAQRIMQHVLRASQRSQRNKLKALNATEQTEHVGLNATRATHKRNKTRGTNKASQNSRFVVCKPIEHNVTQRTYRTKRNTKPKTYVTQRNSRKTLSERHKRQRIGGTKRPLRIKQ